MVGHDGIGNGAFHETLQPGDEQTSYKVMTGSGDCEGLTLDRTGPAASHRELYRDAPMVVEVAAFPAEGVIAGRDAVGDVRFGARMCPLGHARDPDSICF